MSFNANYHEYKLEVKAVIPGSLSSFLYAYCKTINCNDTLEPHFIRKAISFAKLSRFVCKNIANDFDLWYRVNGDSPALLEVLATLINSEENRTLLYPIPVKVSVSKPFQFKGIGLEYVLVPIKQPSF